MGLLRRDCGLLLGRVEKIPRPQKRAGVILRFRFAFPFCISVLHKVYNRAYKSMRRHTETGKMACKKVLKRKEKQENPCGARVFLLELMAGLEPVHATQKTIDT